MTKPVPLWTAEAYLLIYTMQNREALIFISLKGIYTIIILKSQKMEDAIYIG